MTLAQKQELAFGIFKEDVEVAIRDMQTKEHHRTYKIHVPRTLVKEFSFNGEEISAEDMFYPPIVDVLTKTEVFAGVTTLLYRVDPNADVTTIESLYFDKTV